MIEKYIEASGIAWTHLHPNVFMDNLLTFSAPRGGTVMVFFGEQRVGWTALKDLAAVAADDAATGTVSARRAALLAIPRNSHGPAGGRHPQRRARHEYALRDTISGRLRRSSERGRWKRNMPRPPSSSRGK